MSELSTPQTTAEFPHAGRELSTRQGRLTLNIYPFRSAYESASPALHEIVAASRDKARGLAGIDLQLARIIEDIPDYPRLMAAATLSPEIRRGIILVEAGLDDQRRKFSDRRMVHHTYRNAEAALRIFEGHPYALTAALIQLAHDLKEDTKDTCQISIPMIAAILGSEVAEGVDLMTIERPRSKDFYEDILLKRIAKTDQTRKMAGRPNIVVLETIDSTDAPASDYRDYKNESLIIVGDDVIKKSTEKKVGRIEDFEARWHDSAQHHYDYMRILKAAGIQPLHSVDFNFAKAADVLDADFQNTAAQLTQFVSRSRMRAHVVTEQQTQAGDPAGEHLQADGRRGVSRRRFFRTFAEAASLGGVTVLRTLKP